MKMVKNNQQSIGKTKNKNRMNKLEKKDIERKGKESMKETDIEICLKKINKNLGNIKK